MTPKLTPYQATMLRLSGFDPIDGNGYGIELRGSPDWAAARKLVKLGLGWIEGGRPNGSELPGLFFANHEGTAVNFADELAAWETRKGRW
ncbi:hypothetical protein [Novosphingobium colocasiae]|uniref:Uncharacterized protein n=1 Tax=Novosphingobium colocasiae TaxID=1256513 RepID=A0A918PF64_9SPHN|nr:hypothetical protein [Novosphingobium colocasiae]GGZ02382.1 hypothetical protein GCM10011614_16820 [Novosphingobium colocasiae]